MARTEFSKIVHERGRNEYREDFVSLDPSKWPEEWKTTYYKEYPRFPSIKLPDALESDPLLTRIARRASDRNFTGNGLSLEEVSVLMRYSCGQFENRTEGNILLHRAYPSGGARYPTEMYMILRKSRDERLKPGVYHYNIKNDAVEYLWEEKESKEKPKLLFQNEWAENASAVFVMTSVFWRSQNKYGDRGYRFLCIEVGAVIQNLYLLADLLKLPRVAYGGTNDDEVEKLLALDPESESLITAMLIG